VNKAIAALQALLDELNFAKHIIIEPTDDVEDTIKQYEMAIVVLRETKLLRPSTT
jgi:hypothetical protein